MRHLKGTRSSGLGTRPGPSFFFESRETRHKSRRVIFIVGPTASGKSGLAVALAKRLGGEVISADSMLVYKGMEIGTAKLTPRERSGVRHHGIDLVPHTKNFSVFAYHQVALRAIKDVLKRGKVPIIAGGTGFYVRALLEGLSPQPGANPSIRRKLEAEAQNKGLPALYSRLLRIDRKRALAIGPHNQRRIIRALEIYETSGKKPSQPKAKTPGLKEMGYDPIVIGLNRDRAALYQAINNRVDQMFRKGLVREVQRLSKKKFSTTALQGVGYKEVLEYLHPCHCDLAVVLRQQDAREAISKTRSPRRPQGTPRDGAALAEVRGRIKQSTRHFAKRQWTWFKREKGIRWVWWPEAVSIEPVRDFILRMIRNDL